jgi:hypothetical protein
MDQLMSIQAVPDATLDLLLAFLDGLGISHSVYGVILAYDNIRLNPIHPLIASYLVDGTIVLPNTFEMIIYEWNTTFNEASAEDIGMLIDILAKIRHLEVDPIEGSLHVEETLDEILVGFLKHGAEVNFSVVSENIPQYVVTPVQFISKSIVYPYYGLIESRNENGGSYQSKNLFPMVSGNISGEGNTDFDSTCCGAMPSTRYDSLKVLNDMNCDSLYHDYLVATNYENFVSACQEVSISLLQTLKD